MADNVKALQDEPLLLTLRTAAGSAAPMAMDRAHCSGSSAIWNTECSSLDQEAAPVS
ncbi:MAG: hypothetical protein OXC14_10775 [Rhodospirillaceae bacterium]|nr:hypothetical protein [Rhodospirillaceae bacterium]